MPPDIDDAATGRGDDRPPLWKRLAPIVVALGIVIYIFGWVLPQFIDYAAVFRAIGRLDLLEWVLLVLAAGLRVIPEGWVYVAAQPGLSTRQGTYLFLVSNALANIPPGGLDVISRYQMTRSWGFPPSSATAATLLSWISVTLGKLIMPAIAVAALALRGVVDGDVNAAAVLGATVLVIIAIVLTVLLRSPALSVRIGNALGRFVGWVVGLFGREIETDFGALVRDFREQSAEVLRTRWRMSVATGVAAQLANYFVLFLALRFVGIGTEELHWSVALSAFALVAVVTTVPVFNIPGISEAVYIGVLTAAAGSDNSDLVAAAVFVFRILTWLAPIIAGGVAYSRWRDSIRRTSGTELLDAFDEPGDAQRSTSDGSSHED